MVTGINNFIVMTGLNFKLIQKENHICRIIIMLTHLVISTKLGLGKG